MDAIVANQEEDGIEGLNCSEEHCPTIPIHKYSLVQITPPSSFIGH